MAIELYHHPYSRASTVLWMHEEVGTPYSLRPVDILAGEQKSEDIVRLNPMGKLPIMVDEGTVITEVAAIGLYLADRYAPGRLAPALDDPARGTYLPWSLFAPSVIEPGSMAKLQKWEYKAGSAGWGTHEEMLAAMESAVAGGDFIVGEKFTMADVIFGGTLRFMLKFKMVAPTASFTAYVNRLEARPALQKADAKNDAIIAELGLNKG